MRFITTEDIWAMDALNPVEWHFLCELPEVASGAGMDPNRVKNRLFPSPIGTESGEEEALEPDTEQPLSDWHEFVQPEIETLFTDARKLVTQDLGTAEALPARDFFDSEELDEMSMENGDVPDYHRLMIPHDHTDSWYSVLNQARLLMNEEHEIADSWERFAAYMGIDEESEIRPDQAMVLAQYEMYSAIQSILVEKLMK